MSIFMQQLEPEARKYHFVTCRISKKLRPAALTSTRISPFLGTGSGTVWTVIWSTEVNAFSMRMAFIVCAV